MVCNWNTLMPTVHKFISLRITSQLWAVSVQQDNTMLQWGCVFQHWVLSTTKSNLLATKKIQLGLGFGQLKWNLLATACVTRRSSRLFCPLQTVVFKLIFQSVLTSSSRIQRFWGFIEYDCATAIVISCHCDRDTIVSDKCRFLLAVRPLKKLFWETHFP